MHQKKKKKEFSVCNLAAVFIWKGDTEDTLTLQTTNPPCAPAALAEISTSQILPVLHLLNPVPGHSQFSGISSVLQEEIPREGNVLCRVPTAH